MKLILLYFYIFFLTPQTKSFAEDLYFINKNFIKIGATLNYHELGTKKQSLFLKDFKFLTPANAAKQSRVHPRPGVWQWERIDKFLKFAKINDLMVRIHGPEQLLP